MLRYPTHGLISTHREETGETEGKKMITFHECTRSAETIQIRAKHLKADRKAVRIVIVLLDLITPHNSYATNVDTLRRPTILRNARRAVKLETWSYFRMAEHTVPGNFLTVYEVRLWY